MLLKAFEMDGTFGPQKDARLGELQYTNTLNLETCIFLLDTFNNSRLLFWTLEYS